MKGHLAPPHFIRGVTMSLKSQAAAVLAALPKEAFGSPDVAAVNAWVEFVISVHDPPTHPADFYVAVARVLAEEMGSLSPQDLADDHMRTMILETIKPGAQPFQSDGSSPLKEVRLKPAHVSCALMVHLVGVISVL